jgi:hypothetical protein
MLDQSLPAHAVTSAGAATDCTAPAWLTPAEMALADLAETWGAYYDTGYAGGAFHAFRLTGGPVITASTLDGLDSAIRADWARWCAP